MAAIQERAIFTVVAHTRVQECFTVVNWLADLDVLGSETLCTLGTFKAADWSMAFCVRISAGGEITVMREARFGRDLKLTGVDVLILTLPRPTADLRKFAK